MLVWSYAEEFSVLLIELKDVYRIFKKNAMPLFVMRKLMLCVSMRKPAS
jgi:hypothetical protein